MTDLPTDPDRIPRRDPSQDPSRVLLVSATMGAGHHAAARALEEAAHRLWPGCETSWLDVLDVMGPGVGRLFRRIYVSNVQRTPWLYDYFYGTLLERRWFATASKGVVAAWAGRALRAAVEKARPDLVLSTSPHGNAGLARLRRRGELGVPAAAWIPDFAPDTFWLYPHLDRHFVMHDRSARAALRAEPAARVTVAAPPVVRAFAPGERAGARRALGLAPDGFVAVVSCGYFGFGTVDKAVDALLAADPRVQVVALCGTNERLREQLAERDYPDRLVPLGWVDDVPRYLHAADVVVNNGGAATVLETLACGRLTIMFEPIAGHGRANAELMTEAGLALSCDTADELATTVRSLLADPGELARLAEIALAYSRRRTVDDALRIVWS